MTLSLEASTAADGGTTTGSLVISTGSGATELLGGIYDDSGFEAGDTGGGVEVVGVRSSDLTGP
jgi:hypothetical protein